jgi:hypothetical protein
MKTKKRIGSSVAVLLVLAGTSCQHQPTQPQPIGSGARVEIGDAKTTSDQRVILYEWLPGGHGEARNAVLGGDYGLMVFYDAFSEAPRPRFCLYVNETASVVQTASVEQFKKELGRIPAGQTLHYYNTCGGGTHHGLNPAVLEDLQEHCAMKDVTFQKGDAELFTICVCR